MEPLANLPPVRMDYQYTARTILDQPEVYGAWNGTISMKDVPEGEEITLWAVDAEAMSAHKLKESVRLMTCAEKGKTVQVVALN